MSETAQVNGVIEKISFSGIRNTDYGEKATCFVRINGSDYSCNVSPYNGILKLQTKVGKTYTDVKEGMQVAFNYEKNESNGKVYLNFRSSDLFILASGSASQPVQATNAPQTTTNTNEPQRSSETSEKELTDKFCDGLAALIAAYKFKGKEKPEQEQVDRVANYIKKIFG